MPSWASLVGATGNGSAGEGLVGPVMAIAVEEPLQFADGGRVERPWEAIAPPLPTG